MTETKKSWLRPIIKGTLLRCPNCEQATMFDGMFKLKDTCPVCDVRFERDEGESIGGMMMLLIFAELFSIGGFFLTEFLFDPPLTFSLLFWIAFNLIFIVLAYRHTRGLWVGVVYLTGNVITDEQAERKAATKHNRWG